LNKVMPSMPVLPLPMIVALILGYLLMQAVMRRDASWQMIALLGICAVQAAVIAANQYYRVPGFGAVQPVIASVVPPLAWLAFRTTAVRRLNAARDMVHLAGPVMAVVCLWLAPRAMDQVVTALFISYGGAMLVALRGGRDALLRTGLGSGDTPLFIWRGIGCALILSGLVDVLIVVVQATGHGAWQGAIVGVTSSLSLLVLGALGLSRTLHGGDTEDDAGAAEPHDTATDAALMARLEAMMTERRPYLDPDLTLGQLARRLHVPVKALSVAINRSQGRNVSRFINAYRIAHACRLLQQGGNVTSAMLSSGFNTKSNFNREFLRVQGMAPRDWIEKHGTAHQDIVDNTEQAAI
jgi:AraC-like DNA-binding protein